MAKRSKKQTRKIRNLVMLCAICAIVLTVSTYAWFIGMKTVRVSSFDIDIATTEGLFLSMDGNEWTYTLDARNALAYEGNTNTWAETGLIPMSTVGDMDSKVSRMKLFEKASLTTTHGGYRLLTSRVGNYVTTSDDGAVSQGKGYVAFDLFIKNLSGEEYYAENNQLNEEAIYLTTDSAVTIASSGAEPNTGIENSVRVAFTQVGRVEADSTNVKEITGMTCKSTGNVTGICRDAQIWEPNDTAHVQNAINWYNTSCLKRTGATVTEKSSYVMATKTDDAPTNCGRVYNGTAYSTYAVSRDILIGDNVDVYDGADFNGYDSNTIDYATYSSKTDRSAYKLVDVDYFTDTEKNLRGTERPTFMSLAPNSITKLRVYIFIEGQDVDNYDFASLGKKISVKFGFTKERFFGEDINYDDSNTATLPDDVIASKSE